MARKVLSTAVGIVIAVILVMLMETLGHQFYPPPEDFDPQDVEAFREFAQSLPIGALLFLLLAWASATFVGSVFAGYFGREQKLAYFVGGFIVLGAILNLVLIPHPVWFSTSTITSIVAMTFVGKLLSAKLLYQED